MHQKFTEDGRCCMQNNQFPTKSPIGLKDISAVLPVSALPAIFTYQG
jgi:hypothetical protein